MSKYSLGKTGLYSSRFRSGVAAIFSPRVRRERARRDGFRPDITDEDVRERYYSRDLTLEDVVKWNLAEDVAPSDLNYQLQDVARKIGMHNLVHIDIEAANKLGRSLLRDLVTAELSHESTAEEIQAVMLGSIEEVLKSPYAGEDRYHKYCDLKLTREKLPEYVITFPEEEEELARAFYEAELTLEQVRDNPEIFAGKRCFGRLDDRYRGFVENSGFTEEKYRYILHNMPELLAEGMGEMIRAAVSIDIDAPIEQNREAVANYYRREGIDKWNSKVAVHYIPLQEILELDKEISTDVKERHIPELLRQVDEKTFLEYIPLEVLEEKDAYNALAVLEKFGFEAIRGFERENGPIFSANNFKNLKYINTAYLHYAGNRWSDNVANLYVKPYDAGDRPYTREEFNETMRRIILYGTTDGNAKVKLDYRSLQGPFREANPDLFISLDAPEELQDKFYTTKITLKDLEEHPEYIEYLSGVNLDMCLERPNLYFEDRPREVYGVLEGISSREEVFDFVRDNQKTMKYLNKRVDSLRIEGETTLEQIRMSMERRVENEIKSRVIRYSEDAPDFFKEKYPEMFLSPDAPEELKLFFYDDYYGQSERYARHHSTNYRMTFTRIKEHPEWSEYLKGKKLSRAFPGEYIRMFDLLGQDSLMKLVGRNAESLDKMVNVHKENTLANWYNATGGKFIPHHTVMLNFPEQDMDAFLTNGKKWSQLARIDRFNFNDEGKTATLKLAYAMGTFHGDDTGYKRVVDMLTLPPNSISSEDYRKVMEKFADNPEKLVLIQESYILGEDGRYIYKAPAVERGEGVDQKQAKKIADGKVSDIRLALEAADVSSVLTPEKAHQMFDAFDMKYDPRFVEFFMKHQEEIMSNPEYTKDIALIQRRFSEITRDNAGRTLTLELASEYIRSNSFDGVEIGNEGLAEQAKIAGYSQQDFDKLQVMYNEGQARDYSSIPRVTGEKDGYTYEMLRCDDPLALSIGTLTDCCQQINGAGQTSMEHSVLSEDGRVFVVRDSEGRIVAQSWFWRNQYTGCFDNIEIPKRIFAAYEREHPEEGREGLTRAVLGVYKQATVDLMREDERVYKELLDAGTITAEQYEALRLGKVTIGLGFNDIAEAIKSDGEVYRDTDPHGVIQGGRVPHPYTDAKEQYVVAERDGLVESSMENLHVHEDTIPVYDSSNLSATTVTMMKRMEGAAGKDDLGYVQIIQDGVSVPPEQLVTRVARGYGLNPETTKVAATARMAVVYSAEEVGPVRMGSILTAPVSEELPEEAQKKAREHIDYQLKKTLRQITANGKRVLDIDSLSEADRAKVEELLQVIKKENEERGPRE